MAADRRSRTTVQVYWLVLSLIASLVLFLKGCYYPGPSTFSPLSSLKDFMALHFLCKSMVHFRWTLGEGIVCLGFWLACRCLTLLHHLPHFILSLAVSFEGYLFLFFPVTPDILQRGVFQVYTPLQGWKCKTPIKCLLKRASTWSESWVWEEKVGELGNSLLVFF